MPALTQTEAADLFRQEPHRYLDVGAGEVAHRQIGSGPDVLFVHGWPVSGATFRQLLPHLIDHVTCHIIDLPSAGSSRFNNDTVLTVEQHITSVQRVVDLLELSDVALVGHDSGGLISRYAMAGDSRLRSLSLINSECPNPRWRFKSFIAARNLPGFGPAFSWVAGKSQLRRFPLVLGNIFADSSLLEGEFDEFFLEPLHTNAAVSEAAIKVLQSFDLKLVDDLPSVHRRIDVPVKLVWGDQDPFFPVAGAKEMLGTFPNASLDIIEGAGLFSHEEMPAKVAEALLPTLLGQD